MYFRACDCPKGHHKHPGADPACCSDTAAAGLGATHFQPARDPGRFYQRNPSAGFGIEASNIGPVITRREMRGRTQQVRPVWTNNPDIRAHAIHGFGDDVVSTRVAEPSMETAVLPAMAPVEDPLAQRPILLTTMNTAAAPAPSGCSEGLTLDPISGQCMRTPWNVVEGSPPGASVAPVMLPAPEILPAPPFVGPGPEAVPFVCPGFNLPAIGCVTQKQAAIAGGAALVLLALGGIGIYLVVRK